MSGSRTFTVGRLRAALLLVRQSAELLTSADGHRPRRRLHAFAGAKALRARDGDLKLLLDFVLAARGAGGVVVAVAVDCRGDKGMRKSMRGNGRVEEVWRRRKLTELIRRRSGGEEMK